MTNSLSQTPKPDHGSRSQKKPLIAPKLKRALDLMAYEGLPYDEAARKADLTVRAVRYALGRPVCIQYLREQRMVLRASIGGRNLLRLREIAEQNDNKAAAVKAIQVIEGLDDVDPFTPRHGPLQAGLVIQVISGPQPQPPAQTIEGDAREILKPLAIEGGE